MKRILSILVTLLFLTHSSWAQISLVDTFNTGFSYMTKFGNAGYKYVIESRPTIKIYNLNHSLYSTFNIPITVTVVPTHVFYLSDNLFDLDNNIEYVYYVTGHPSLSSKIYIIKDNGTILFYKDSAAVSGTTNFYGDVFKGQNMVYNDGSGTKMRVARGFYQNVVSKTEIYSLPGTIPCDECTPTGTHVGKPEYNTGNNGEPIFFPNPATDHVKLKYELPKDTKIAKIRVTDLQGKLVEEYKVTSDFDFIYLPSNFNNGLYFYSLEVDGKKIKTEKIVLSK